MGSLPNGSGLRFGEPGTATAGDNVAAAAVIWEWLGARRAHGGVAGRARHPRDPADGHRPVSGRERRGRWRALAIGLLVVALYAGLAAWSGRLSPLARGPQLDGLGPLNYRWVSPPPELASTNQPPSAGRFVLPLRADGLGSQVVFTSDNQVTVIVDEGSVGPSEGQRSVELTVDPLDPADLAPPGGSLAAFGNAYRLGATYQPSGDRIRELDAPISVVLLYLRPPPACTPTNTTCSGRRTAGVGSRSTRPTRRQRSRPRRRCRRSATCSSPGSRPVAVGRDHRPPTRERPPRRGASSRRAWCC